MTAQELIEALSRLRSDTPIYRHDGEYGPELSECLIEVEQWVIPADRYQKVWCIQ